MAKVTGLKCYDENEFSVLAHSHGNNIAFRCLGCGAPVLAVILENQLGADEQHPTNCQACGRLYWVELVVDKLIVRNILKAPQQ